MQYSAYLLCNTWCHASHTLLLFQKDASQGADMAAAPITVTRMREAFVDFVKPFQHMGLTVVMKRLQPSLDPAVKPYSFRIFQPLTAAVWGLVVLSAIVVSELPYNNNYDKKTY